MDIKKNIENSEKNVIIYYSYHKGICFFLQNSNILILLKSIEFTLSLDYK